MRKAGLPARAWNAEIVFCFVRSGRLNMKYDAIIVGASIAGLYTGMKLSQSGWKVAIIDRRKEIGLPVRCGEATGSREELSRFLKVTDDLIACEVKGMKMYCGEASPIRLDMPRRSVILHRDRLEKALAGAAQKAGARMYLETSVIGLQEGPGGGFRGVRAEHEGLVEGRYIIGADGCESKVGQWAGITRCLRPGETFSSNQYRLQTDLYNDGYLHFFTGPQQIPAGYIWVFPKTPGRVLVGAGLYGCVPNMERASVFLDRFIEKNLTGAVRLQRITGCVPLAVCPKRLYRSNVAVVGDAARQANPLTAGGIMNTFEAADCLVKALTIGDPSSSHERAFSSYGEKWSKQRFNQRVFYFIKEVFLSMNEKQIAAVVGKAQKTARGSITANKPFSFTFPLLFRLCVVLAPALLRYFRGRTRNSPRYGTISACRPNRR